LELSYDKQVVASVLGPSLQL